MTVATPSPTIMATARSRPTMPAGTRSAERSPCFPEVAKPHTLSPKPSMSAMPPPPPSSPPPGPAPTPAPGPKPPRLPPADPQALMPYDDLFGSEERAPEAPPNLTFNVAAAPPPPAPKASGPAKPPIDIDVPGIVVG